MTQAEWKTFLYDLSRIALTHDMDRNLEYRTFSPEVHASGYLGYDGASEELIVAAERRLGTILSPSYKDFLRVSNGWPVISDAVMPGRLWPVEEVYWIRDYDPHDTKGWGEMSSPPEDIPPEEHIDWGSQEIRSGSYRHAYVKNLLSISDYGDACNLLLSPEVVNEEAEWECWLMASWNPGADRYQSFEAWIKNCYEFWTK